LNTTGRGKFRSAAEAGVRGVKHAAEVLESRVQDRFIRLAAGSGRGCPLHELSDHVSARLLDPFAIALPGFGDALQNCAESGAAVAIVGREVRSAEEWLQVRRQKDGHGPAAAAGGRLHEGHVDAVDVGALLAIHLHRHERSVENRRDGVAFERFALHDVAPVAGRIAD
jgi:hypothetical protein